MLLFCLCECIVSIMNLDTLYMDKTGYIWVQLDTFGYILVMKKICLPAAFLILN